MQGYSNCRNGFWWVESIKKLVSLLNENIVFSGCLCNKDGNLIKAVAAF